MSIPRRTRCCVKLIGHALMLSVLSLVITTSGSAQSSDPVTHNRTDSRALPPLPATSSVVPRADAGDDQIGVVGSRITLNGGRSGPRGRIGFRWLQVEGPPVSESSDDRYIHEFVPTVPGLYRFALLVAADQYISPPDLVTIAVVSRPPTMAVMASEISAKPQVCTLAAQTLASVEGGAAAGNSLAETFESVAARIDLYRSYRDLFGELSRRLESSLPTDPGRRSAWIDRMLTPLSQSMVEALKLEGLDLTRIDHQSATMTPAQRVRLAEHFRAISQGFRTMPPLVVR